MRDRSRERSDNLHPGLVQVVFERHADERLIFDNKAAGLRGSGRGHQSGAFTEPAICALLGATERPILGLVPNRTMAEERQFHDQEA